MSDRIDRPVTINAAFLQELKEVNQELWQTLDNVRALCGQPLSMRLHSRSLVDLLARLRDLLAMHFALEEAFGYFHHAKEVEPEMDRSAKQLRAQHSPMYLRASELADRAENFWRERDDAMLTAVLPVGVDQFVRDLLQHEAGENELIYRTLYESIGVAD